MEEKKYELTDEILEWHGHILHRIKALKDFSHVKKGDLGGWIEKEDNLSQDFDCWVYDDAKVFENARISLDAIIFDKAEVSDNAKVYDHAWIYGNAVVFDDAEVYDYAEVWGTTLVYGNAKVSDNAEVYGNAEVFGNAIIFRNAKVSDDAYVFDSAKVGGDAHIGGNAWVCGNAEIFGNAKVNSIRDYMVFKNSWSSGRWFTWTKSNDMWCVGCFYGTGKQLIEKAYDDSEESGRNYAIIVNTVKQINNEEEIRINR